MVRQPATPHRRSSRYVSDSGPTHWRVLRRLLGLHPTPKAAILADLVAALKVESEAALGSPITTVSVTAPWVGDWQDELPTDSVVNDALASAGLKPWTMEARWPVYLGEAGAVHAANGKWHCQHQSCGISNLSFGWPDSTFFIRSGTSYSPRTCLHGRVLTLSPRPPSFTNESVYTVIHAAQCFFQTHEVNPYPSSISTQYGLSHLASAPTPVEFWDKLRLHLLDQVALFSKRKIFIYPTFEVVTAGEAADHPDFLEVVQEVHREIPRVREEHGILGFTPKPLVVSEDPGWAAARGAAFWLGTRMDPHYCDEVKKIAEEAEQLCRRWKLEGCRDEL